MTQKQHFTHFSLNRNNDNPLILQSGLILFGIAVVVLAWGITLHQLSKHQTSLLDSLEREQSNLSAVLAENLFQTMEQKQAIEMIAVNWLDNQDQRSMSDINNFLYGEHFFTRVVLYHLSGETFYQSSPYRKNDQQNKEYINKHIEHLLSSGHPVFIDNHANSSQIPWQIPILFPLKNNDVILGAMFLELDIGYLLNFLRDINIGRTGMVTISDNYGKNLACFESGGLAIGKSLPKQTLISSRQDNSGSGISEYKGSKNRHFAYMHVREYPFIVVVSQEVDEVLSEFQLHKKRLLWALLVLTSFCLSGLYFLLKMINRKHQYLNELAISYEKNNELILKLEQEHQASAKAASVDTLTGLYNRRLFIHLAEKKLSSAKRNRLAYAVLFIDLDRFKTINDTLGHRIGDLLLKAVGTRLSGCTRKSDIVARFGGDEFVVMLSEVSAEHNILPIVEKIISSISEPCENLEGHRINTSPSVGIAVYPRDGSDIETLLLNADAAMYKSKKTGRGRFSFFDASLNTASIQRFEMEQSMPAAITEDEFVLHYQPKIRLTDYRVVGLEALIRWQHSSEQLIYPNDFIEIAEETGLIAQLGAWVISNACKQIVSWKEDGLNVVPVAVNVSPLELRNPDYAKQFLRVLDLYHLPPKLIEVEVTENAFIEDKAVVIGNLQILSEKGVNISLDDYGKGFSSLENIRSLPISSLKIDRSFIQDIRNNYSDNAIVYSIIILAQKLKMKVVAEGVETHDQLINLKVTGCDQVQGYYFSRPVPEQKIREFMISPIRSLSA